MATLADHAYNHCRAVVDEPAASEAAIVAVRRGGRSRSSVLAFARYHALRRATWPDHEGTERVSYRAVPAELPELVRQRPRRRPPLERAIVDLGSRHGLDRSKLGRALGLSPVAATAR